MKTNGLVLEYIGSINLEGTGITGIDPRLWNILAGGTNEHPVGSTIGSQTIQKIVRNYVNA